MGKLESNFQASLKKELRARYPGCFVLKNDPAMNQGIPDLTILYKNKWACLEVKKSEAVAKSKSGKRPNQEPKIDILNSMSYATFIYPENKEDVLNELDRTFGLQRPTRKVQSK